MPLDEGEPSLAVAIDAAAPNYGGGPVGVETMAAALSEPRDAIEDIIEPFLIQCGSAPRAAGS
jgi:holliday junction DNA helicase RuvB